MSNDVQQFSIQELLCQSDQYIIPMYQRNYAWEEGEITQLIQDIIDNLGSDQDYYIGSLVVFERINNNSTIPLFETIDGQQRLTTLLLLASYLNHQKIRSEPLLTKKLQFDSREKSSYTLNLILQGNFKRNPRELLDPKKTNLAILNGYELIEKNLPLKLNYHTTAKSQEEFADFLFNKVQLIRVTVPEDTDLNHYFEIMNSRGEQLELHEILKAHLLKVLERIENSDEKEASKACLHAIWEACSNMEKYVQMGFETGLRSKIFGPDWEGFEPTKFADLSKFFTVETEDDNPESNGESESTPDNSLAKIISNSTKFLSPDKKENTDQKQDHFHPPINFPNFLLHVLRVMTREKGIQLDDKRLIPIFQENLIRHGSGKVQDFAYSLLKCKWLFDHYVIKREFIDSSDDWSLKIFRKSKEQNSGYYRNTFENDPNNKSILMLLAAFHVSTPTMVYKHWLNATLHYLNLQKTPIESNSYLLYLESVAKAFVFDIYLSDNPKDYFEIIYTNSGQCLARIDHSSIDSLQPFLIFSNIRNNFIFNYLDYLLWLKHKDNVKHEKVAGFKFTFRSSVEHYYPQNPEHIPRLKPNDLNAFGNLCLISHSKNSRLSNFTPEAKKSDYQGENTPIDSIKQHLMMEDTPPWSAAKILAHTAEMIETLKTGPKQSATGSSNI